MRRIEKIAGLYCPTQQTHFIKNSAMKKSTSDLLSTLSLLACIYFSLAQAVMASEIDTPANNWQYVGADMNGDQVYVDRGSVERGVEKTHMLRISVLFNYLCKTKRIEKTSKQGAEACLESTGWASTVMELNFSCKPNSASIFGTRDWKKYSDFSAKGKVVGQRVLPQKIEMLEITNEMTGLSQARVWGCEN